MLAAAPALAVAAGEGLTRSRSSIIIIRSRLNRFMKPWRSRLDFTDEEVLLLPVMGAPKLAATDTLVVGALAPAVVVDAVVVGGD